MYVHWGTVGWVQKTIDFVVPVTVDGANGVVQVPTSFVVWMRLEFTIWRN
jgi:hypothetical protein